MNANDHRQCPSCGQRVSGGLHGLCPNCLALLAFQPDPELSQTVSMPAASGEALPLLRPATRYVGDYELMEEVARGGMGVVYKARQTSLNRIVAVKMILGGRLATDQDVKRFRKEAEAAANLQHPNIVSIHETGEHEGRQYFSMDFVEGKNLAQALQGKPLPAGKAAELLKTIAEAVHYAHQRGTLHRDLKPHNILIDASGQPRITDFGLAKRNEEGAELTQTGAILGSPSYMPPEQAAGHHDKVGPASDVYSLGAILYQLLTGKPPFIAETPIATLRKVLEEEPERPARISASVPTDLETICLKCLEKAPEQRYHSARELADELERFVNHEPILARPASQARKAWSWIVRHPWAISGMASALVLGMIGLAYALWEQTRFLQFKAARADQLPAIRKAAESADISFGWMMLLAVSVVIIPWAHFTARKVRGEQFSGRQLNAYAAMAAAQILAGIFMVLRWINAATWDLQTFYASKATLYCAFSFAWFGAILAWKNVAERWGFAPSAEVEEPKAVQIRWWNVGCAGLTIVALCGTFFALRPIFELGDPFYWPFFGLLLLGAMIPWSLAILRVASRPAKPLWGFFVAFFCAVGSYMFEFQSLGQTMNLRCWGFGVLCGILLAWVAQARLAPAAKGRPGASAVFGVKRLAIGFALQAAALWVLSLLVFDHAPSRETFFQTAITVGAAPILVHLMRVLSDELRFVPGLALAVVIIANTDPLLKQIAPATKGAIAGLICSLVLLVTMRRGMPRTGTALSLDRSEPRSPIFSFIALAASVALIAAVLYRTEAWPFSIVRAREASLRSSTLPKGWVRPWSENSSRHIYGARAEVGADYGIAHSGRASVFIRHYPDAEYSGINIVQLIRAAAFKGKRVRLSAHMKTRNIGRSSLSDAAALTISCDGGPPRFVFAAQEHIVKAPKWRPVTIVMDVPSDATLLEFGISLWGGGEVWADDFEIETVSRSVPLTHTPWRVKHAGPKEPGKPLFEPNAAPMNLGFED